MLLDEGQGEFLPTRDLSPPPERSFLVRKLLVGQRVMRWQMADLGMGLKDLGLFMMGGAPGQSYGVRYNAYVNRRSRQRRELGKAMLENYKLEKGLVSEEERASIEAARQDELFDSYADHE